MNLRQTVNYLFISIFIVGFTHCQKKEADNLPEMIGPYVQSMTQNEVTLCWSTMIGTTQIRVGDSIIHKVNQYSNHKSVITRLKPNTTYSYDVLNDGTDWGKGTFTTFPDSIQAFHFAVLGDTRTRHSVHQTIVNRIIEENPLFVINTGDLVSQGNNMNDWEHFFRINDSLIRHVPYYTVLGNHEQDSENYYDFFSLPGNESYYFFSVGDALFIILDMEGPDYETPEYLQGESRNAFWTDISKKYFEEEKEWLENILNLNNDAGYIFVFFHPTYYSIKKSRVADAELRREFWGDVFERHDVTAVLNGHDHYYHHAENRGTHYIVTGGGGAPLYATDSIQAETVAYKKIEHYVRVNVGIDNTSLEAIDINGDLIEEIIVERRK
ncbi:MAG: metallophosphoesterase family protein [Bacteroidetes bacterium]|nr:metallophosphoesterase family protein [Bacteroidota bacterium]MBT3751730.1 metallophosphoesterase family protein [Bacteroidota bacterium]MBT4410959.1 metallophosphoesterase family protein [Bacteroidota bacterium]MBT5425377.1 metallophosphoesterase family protein [Bacteroidota bacterium]MBT7092015.1 metallophosphoesterase family protein [Bacteroidota bacterium]